MWWNNPLQKHMNRLALAPEDGGAGGEGAPAGGDGGGGQPAAGQGQPSGGGQDAGQGGQGQPSTGQGGQEVTLDVVKQALPEDLRNDPSIAKQSDLEGFARTFKHAQQMIGKDPSQIIEKPADPQDPEQRKQVLQHLGLPDTPDGFQLEQPKDSDGNPIESVPADTEMAQGFKQKAHELGILPDQAQALFNWFGEQVSSTSQQTQQQTQQQAQENIEMLKKEWGQAFDQNVQAANFAVQQLDEGQDGSLSEKLDKAGLGADPEVIKALAQVGKMMAEDGAAAVGGEQGSNAFGNAMAPDQARAKGKELLRQSQSETSQRRSKELAQQAQQYFDLANRGAGS